MLCKKIEDKKFSRTFKAADSSTYIWRNPINTLYKPKILLKLWSPHADPPPPPPPPTSPQHCPGTPLTVTKSVTTWHSICDVIRQEMLCDVIKPNHKMKVGHSNRITLSLLRSYILGLPQWILGYNRIPHPPPNHSFNVVGIFWLRKLKSVYCTPPHPLPASYWTYKSRERRDSVRDAISPPSL